MSHMLRALDRRSWRRARTTVSTSRSLGDAGWLRSSRRISSAALVAVLSGALVGGGLGAAALFSSPATRALPADATEQPDPAPALTVTPASPILGIAATNYEFSVEVSNPGEREIPAGRLRILFDPQRLENDTQLADFIAADAEALADRSPVTIASVDVPATAAESEQQVTVTVPRDELPLEAMSDPGVYGFRAELRQGSSDALRLSAATSAVWRSTALGQRVSVALVVPIVLPTEITEMPTADELADASPRLEELVRAAERAQATLAVDPRIIAGVRALGDAAPAAGLSLLERLETSASPMFLLQFADADPVTQSALGMTELLQPIGFGYLTRNATFTKSEPQPAPIVQPTEVTGSDPDSGSGSGSDSGEGQPSDDAGEGESGDNDATPESPDDTPPAPSLDQLLEWSDDALPGAWPADGQVDAKTLTLLKQAGLTQLVLSGSNVTSNTTARATLSGAEALIANEALNAAAALAAAGATETARASGVAELASRLALFTRPGDAGPADPAATRVIALDRGAIADSADPAALVDEIVGLNWVSPIGAADIPLSTGKLKPSGPSEERIALLQATLDRSAEIDRLAPLLSHPDDLLEYQRVRLLDALATRSAAPGTDFDALNRATLARDRELLGGVHVVPSENTQLLGVVSNMPVLVHNSLPFDATVTMRAAPTSAAVVLDAERFRDQVIAAESNSTVLVPVRSRVSSGSSSLIVQVADVGDDTVFSSEILRLTIRSSYETILLVILSVLAVALFGFGVWRSILRRRRGSGTRSDEPESDSMDEPATAMDEPETDSSSDPE